MWYRFAQEIQKLPIPLPDYVSGILSDISNAGGRALIVGGAVRDSLLGISPKDIDFEVYGLSYDQLNDILQKYGKVDLVGKAFGVIKFVGQDGSDFDFSLPRKDSKSGVGHKDFNVEVSSNLTPEEAAARRDFTFNAISYDPLTGEIIDPYNGRKDLQNKIMRHTSDAFAEDALRVLRGMQFASRFGFDIAPETAELANSIRDQYKHLPKERVHEEFKKLVRKGIEPGRALDYLYKTGWSENFPHIHNLKGVPQEPEYHPEGNVDVHTAHVMNEAARIADEQNLSPEDREVLVYAALCHDFAKPKTTKTMLKKGVERITSHGHEEAGGPMAREFLSQIGAPRNIIDKVVPLVENHLNHIHHSNTTKQDSFVKNLAERLHPANIKSLEQLIEADHSGRPPLSKGLPEQAKYMSDKAKLHGVYEGRHPGFLQGKDILQRYPWVQPGAHIGDTLKEHRNYLLKHNELTTQEHMDQWLDQIMKQKTNNVKAEDVIQLGFKGADIKHKLDEAWDLQKQGFNKKEILEKFKSES